MWTLSNITEAQFDKLYNGTVDKSIFQREPLDDQDLITNFLTSKLWRLNNCFTIIDKYGNRIGFQMNYAQHMVYAATIQHPRLIILKSRQQGISTFWLISFLDDALIYPDLNIGLMAQGKTEASTLLRRVELAWEAYPEVLKGLLGLTQTKDTTEERGWSNNSYVFIRTSFRSATLQRLHISELGKIAAKYPDRVVETKRGTLQAIAPGNTVVIESTAEGDNEFKAMWETAVETEQRMLARGLSIFPAESFKPVFLSWVNDPDCNRDDLEEPNLTQEKYFADLEARLGIELTQTQKNFWIAKFRDLGDGIYQEYPATPEEAFTKVNDGSYYGTLYATHVIGKQRKLANLYDSMLPVYVVMDLGMNDTFVMGYFQRFRDEWRLVNEYTNSGEGLAHYVQHMNATGYEIKMVYCPHDITVQELGTGKSRYAILQELGVRNMQILPKLSIEAGIEQVRQRLIPNLWIDERCVYSDGCLKNYSKEWDDARETWKNKPLHDKWSHGADMLRYMAISGAKHVSNPRQHAHEKRAGIAGGLAF